tara:strand:- start:3981 stop:6089 length:2109 start_codon:yes stop_codon:yes gene_type:complete
MPKTQTEKDTRKKSSGPVGVNPPSPTPAKPTPEITPKPKLSVEDNFSQQRANTQNVKKDALKGIVSEEADLTRRMTPTPKKPTPILQGVNSFPDTNAKGFILNKNGNRQTDFIIGSNTITKTNVLDQKGDFSIKPYTAQNKAEPIRKDLGQKAFDTNKFRGEISFPKNNKKDSRGNVILPFNEKKRFQIDVDDVKSRLLIKHTENNFLDNLYAEGKTSNQLGLRKSTRFFTQPFVIKDIDDRWGFGGVEQIPGFKNNTIAKVIDFAGGMLDDIGGAVLGRSPNEYIGNAVGSLERTGKFLITPEGISFLAKQGILQRRNAQKLRTDVRYGIQKSELSRLENPRLYNPLSLGSLPGVTKISINTFDPTLPFDDLKDTIAGYVSNKVIDLATTVKDTVIKKLSGVASDIGNALLSRTPLGKAKERLEETGKDIKRRVGAVSDALTAEGINISKLTGININPGAFSDVGKDRVNLIPYGEDGERATNTSYKDLDFCPFKFYDVNGDNSIVFRAILSGITDTFTPEYSSERYVGRPDSVYVYQGTTREINFTFDVYPKSDEELIRLWEKMNYLAGLTYPEYASVNGGGFGMVAPFCELTIGQMYADTPGYISGLTYTVMDEGTWEIGFAKLPKYIQATCTFVYVGNRLPSSNQKHYELPWVAEEKLSPNGTTLGVDVLGDTLRSKNTLINALSDNKEIRKKVLGMG